MKRTALFLPLLAFFFVSCSTNPKQETKTSGTTTILADESFAPIVDDQLFVFESTYPRADIRLVYKAENMLVNALVADSAKVAIMSRLLSPQEAAVFEKKNIKVRKTRFAIDAVALIASKSSADSTISVQEIIDIMQGKEASRRLVFDNPNSSTVRYLKDLAKISKLPSKGVYALKTNSEVIKFVHNNSGVIGVIGINWYKQPGKELEPLIEGLRVLGVKNLPGKPGSDKFYKPSQDNLAMELYPLSRDLYIIDCQGGAGLGSGFASFLAGETGQRIVLKSGLLPDSIPPREVFIK
ncbi:PstS family phosphate ABC transporter substrate-binding protein [Arcticibacter sp. MXS-1]|uniref:PstS family phosphate ABC transporter substrate-binding protein n=1 Tax=Arcticibacter sp. MXS-1 TaxID=3341726 RepID=UPI0035A8C66C